MASLKEKLHQLQTFLRQGIWEVESTGLPLFRRILLRQGRTVLLVLREFLADRCMMRASALTYTTLLSLVPLLALTFALLSGLGVQKTLQPIILRKITVGSQDLVNQIITYINNTNAGRLGAAGLITLMVTVMFLLLNVEDSFNNVWGVKESRPFFRRFADYTTVLLLGPVFLFIAISMTSSLESQSLVQAIMKQAVIGPIVIFLFRFLPYLLMWVAFIFLYLIMPNVKVRIQAAVIGGIFGGTLWQLAQWGYVSFQVGVSRYNAIYGTMAALPILLAWIYLSWAIVLLGAEVAYVWQNIHIIRREILEGKINFVSQEMVALTIMTAVTRTFEQGERPWGMEKLAARLGLPPRLGRTVIGELVALGFLSEVRDSEAETEGEACFQPGRPPEKVRVHEVIQAFRSSGASLGGRKRTAEWKAVGEVEERIGEASEQALHGMTLADLAETTGKEKEESEG